MKNKPTLILASASPRRKYLLEQAGLTFDVIISDVDESCPVSATPEECVEMLARQKAQVVAQENTHAWVIGADTIVVSNGRICGKPDSTEEAREMLNMLSGTTHRVLTGYCICCVEKDIWFTDVIATDVLFRELDDEQINWYLDTDEPFDKAGAYAIQGLGTFLVKSISGSYTNVVGLPVCEVLEYLMKQGVISRSRKNNE